MYIRNIEREGKKRKKEEGRASSPESSIVVETHGMTVSTDIMNEKKISYTRNHRETPVHCKLVIVLA